MTGELQDMAARLTPLFRAIAWLLVTAIVILSVVPAGMRPVTGPHDVEHAVAFALTGLAFGFGYRNRRAWQLAGLAMFCAAIEIAQIWTPTRHARIGDFVVDTLACFAGIGFAILATRALEGRRSA